MPDECEMMCEMCGKQNATVHITQMFGGVGGKHEITKNLCADCFQKDPSFATLAHQPDLADLIRTGKCNYCGEPPVSGSQSSGPGGPNQAWLLCAQCEKDLEEFAARPENQWEAPDPDGSLDKDAFLAELSRVADQCTEIEARRQKFMRAKVAQRKSGAG